MSNDCSYYYVRAEHEIYMARKAAHPAAFRAHYELADRYLVLAATQVTASDVQRMERH